MMKKDELPTELKLKTDQETRVYLTTVKGDLYINFQQDIIGLSTRIDFTQAKRLCDWFYRLQECLTPDTKTPTRKKDVDSKNATSSV